jgi:hypothetical protein
VYQIIRGEKPNVRQGTIGKIGTGLGMTAAELLAAVAANDGQSAETDPIEAAIRSRAAEMRDAVQGVPRAMWATIIRATFDTAIDGARNMAQLLADVAVPPVSVPGEPRVSASKAAQTRDLDEPKGPLTKRQPLLQRFLTPSLA